MYPDMKLIRTELVLFAFRFKSLQFPILTYVLGSDRASRNANLLLSVCSFVCASSQSLYFLLRLTLRAALKEY